MGQFDVRTAEGSGRVVVALAGECDLSVEEELTAALLAAVAQSPVVVVDLAELRFLDSSGVNALVAAHHAARRSEGHLYVVNAGGVVANVLELTGVGELLRPPPAGPDPRAV